MGHERGYEFGNQLLSMRTRASLTQGALATAVGVHRRSVQNWETGVSYPKAEALQRLIAALARHQALAPGQELAEAQQLWAQVEAHGGPSFPAFDRAWMTSVLGALGEPTRATFAPRPHADAEEQSLSRVAPALRDWGEAIAVPTLYGRERELATLQQWLAGDRCRTVLLLGLGGIGKSSLAIRAAEEAAPHFEQVLFRSLQNAPSLAELLDHLLSAVSVHTVAPAATPEWVPDKITLLVQRFRERRCLLILDNFETVLEPGALSGTYRHAYADYGALLQALSGREHQSCLLLTSREKPAELGLLEGANAPVRMLTLAGLAEQDVRRLLETKAIAGTAAAVGELTRLYGGNPLALKLVAEPIHELFGGDIAGFLATGSAFFNGVGMLIEQQFARSTAIEQAIMYWLAVERELLPLNTLLARLGDSTPASQLLAALESLRRRMLIERGPSQPEFTLQPVILEFVTDQLVHALPAEIMAHAPELLRSHCLVQATAKEYIRRSQERLIARPILERIEAMVGAQAAEQRLISLLERWRSMPANEAGYGPGNIVNLLGLHRGHLSGLDLSQLVIRQGYFQGREMHASSLAGATLHDSHFTETFGAITAISASADGAYWAASSKCGELRVWLAGAQTPYRSWQAHSDSTWDLAFSPDRLTLASCSWDGTVKLWDVETNLQRWSVKHPWHLQKIAFAPDGRVVASSGGGPEVWLLDVTTGAKLQALAHPGAVTGAAWSPDGRLLATGDRAGDVRLWTISGDMATPLVCSAVLRGHTSTVNGFAFDPAGRTLASASWDGTVRLWRLADMSLQRVLSSHSGRVTRVVWSADGATIATGGSDHAIWLWDVARERYRAALREHSSSIWSLAFSHDDRHLISGSEDGTLRIWELASDQCIRVIEGYAILLYDIDWSPDGAQLITGGADGKVSLWDARGAAPARTLHEHRGSVLSVGWSPDGRWAASSDWSAAIELRAITAGAGSQTLQAHNDSKAILYGLVWSPDGRRLASGTYGHGIAVFEVASQHRQWPQTALRTWIRRVVWRPDGAQLAGGGDNGIVYLWDATSGALLRELRGHQGMVNAVAWSPDGAYLASGSFAEGELFIWDAGGELIQRLAGGTPITSALAWGASAELLVSGGSDGILRWWDVRRGVCLYVRAAHQGTVSALRRSPDGTRLASCGIDGVITIWDLQSAALLTTMRHSRPYEDLDIAGASGLTEGQQVSLRILGAVDGSGDKSLAVGQPTEPAAALPPPAADAPAPAGEAGRVVGLPFQPTSFVGRGVEVAEIARLLGEPACRLLTLLGPGGVGKTRLALEVAKGQAAVFADGVAFVGLAAIGTPAQIISAIGDALNLSFAGQPDPRAHLLNYLSRQQMLLVLDNFEHLLAAAELLSSILARAPGVRLIVTSRERLNLQAEWLFDVEGLAYPTEDSDGALSPRGPGALGDYSAVQLFVQRATQLQFGLRIAETELAAIARICTYVAGMPLAIELAAACVRMLPIAEIERQIHSNLDALATTHRDVPARHRSLRAAFDHSWALLDEPQRGLLSRLGVFRRGWSVAAAEEVAGATAATLAALSNKSLVRQDSAVPEAIAEPRFLLLEPIREYALEHLSARGELEGLQQAHASYYLRLAEAAAAQWDAQTTDTAIAQLDREYNNIRAALQWVCTGGDRTLGIQLGGALKRFWRRRGHLGEGRLWLEELLAVDDPRVAPTPNPARVRAVEAAAWLASDQHDFSRAAELFGQGMALRRALGETEDETGLLVNAAIQARAAGRYGQATSLLADAVAWHRALGDRRSLGSAGQGLSLFLLGLVSREQGDFVRATSLFEECVDLHRAIADREGIAVGLLGLSDIARDQGDTALVWTYAAQSLALLRELGVQWAIGFALNNLALAALQDGDLQRAAELTQESVAMFRAQAADASLAEVLITQGAILAAQGDRASAYSALSEALKQALLWGPRLLMAATLEALAALAVQPGRADLAARLLGAAAALRAQMGAPLRPVDQPAVDRMLSAVRLALGPTEFDRLWREAHTLPLEAILTTIPDAATFELPPLQ